MNKYYYAYYKKDEIRNSASGGIGHALAMDVLNKSGIVYGVSYSDDFKSAQYLRINEINKIEKLSGSKYITAEKRMPDGSFVFENVKKDLKDKKLVLFTGLPCEIAALNNYLDRQGIDTEKEKMITVDLICQGPLSSKEQSQYIEFLEKKYKSRLIDFTVRYKNPYWKPVYLKAVFENGKKHIKPLYETDFGRAFLIYGKEGCFHCKYKNENHQADITIGDFWGIKENENGYNKMGTSVVVTHTEKGNDTFKQLANICFGEVTEDKAIDKNSMYGNSREKYSNYATFKSSYLKNDLHKAVFDSRSILSKVKYLLKLLLGLKPY
ncbi:Coenzyme F420 hydrogenase/dehydrogenase, beta subunit C-terminal domain [Blautia sp. MSJ-9]|uniref:Coenzyme F420 hydrogenase/dehydrogenase, beta subunit C-terminal domain n=1 Tax=Blautia sp. MSJ-9 TaxID=2841511 RepID=UPI001C0F7299|nr:Coenzyme F420 hydrogenase/dehydrogenase, beta subunit C-terminal domain [Blautia sp. MSJ-9]MBU5681118.1 Coenzyme F420 hydrogenase/dehydrogenase, beta subunit C-terminal domain [Blautia sp. MSJ-9]